MAQYIVLGQYVNYICDLCLLYIKESDIIEYQNMKLLLIVCYNVKFGQLCLS